MLTTQEEISALKKVSFNQQKQRKIQFFHVQCYSRSLAKNFKTERKDGKGNTIVKEGKRWTVADIAAEADRLEGHIPHVKNPQTPILVAGAPVSELPQICDEVVEGKTQKGGKAVRKDTPVLLAAVYSLPIRGDAYAENKEYCDAFVKDAMKWHEEKYGKVVSCVRHEDEGFLHYHCYSASEDARGLIPGYVAKRAEYDKQIKVGASKTEALKASHKAYIEAMKELQDSYYAELSVKYGLDRYGSRRMRYAPGEVRQKRIDRERQANILRDLILEEEENRRKSEEARFEQAKLKLKAEEEAFEARQTKLRAEHLAEFVEREKARVEVEVDALFKTSEYKQRRAFKDLELAYKNLKERNNELLTEVATQSRLILSLEKQVASLKRRAKQLRQTVRHVISKIQEKFSGGEKHGLKR
jgi:hypothetical protein